ncbi:YciE/YciF ferroxidase family protein [Paludisphaera mucosa]|uniref:Ferritin-like domain-containing protein n=1 Tax=Paludisphaera mucosa TaxID=3030827 RepID=A0ABT6FIW4_9BACT|nr:ferritin-like domain-containing protein [Paludisphaera mucosa]MDG3007436.1 ferritin-like domain-containing protein [Paludisphaera mucosa]
MQSLNDLFVDVARDMLDAEKQLAKALPKMAKAASNPELRKAFEKHLEETKIHAERLAQVLEALGQAPRGKKCHAMEGHIEEGKEILELDAAPEVKDAALIAAAQKVEHYEIAGYGTLSTWAATMGIPEVKKLLGDTLAEEKTTDDLLSEIAETVVNAQAATT